MRSLESFPSNRIANYEVLVLCELFAWFWCGDGQSSFGSFWRHNGVIAVVLLLFFHPGLKVPNCSTNLRDSSCLGFRILGLTSYRSIQFLLQVAAQVLRIPSYTMQENTLCACKTFMRQIETNCTCISCGNCWPCHSQQVCYLQVQLLIDRCNLRRF